MFLNYTTLVDDALHKLRAQLSREELEESRSHAALPHEVSPSEFLRQALDIETAQ